MKNIFSDKKYKKLFQIIGLIVIILLITNIANAQPPGAPGDPDNAPIDGGLSLLVAAGVGYVARKKLKDKS